MKSSTITSQIEIGSIVSAEYSDFDGRKQIGLFLVLYNEKYDNTVSGNYNCTAVKCSSQMTASDSYSVCVNANKTQFLDKPTLVLASKVHTLDIVSNRMKVLGKIDRGTLVKVIKKYNMYNNALLQQVFEEI